MNSYKEIRNTQRIEAFFHFKYVSANLTWNFDGQVKELIKQVEELLVPVIRYEFLKGD